MSNLYAFILMVIAFVIVAVAWYASNALAQYLVTQ